MEEICEALQMTQEELQEHAELEKSLLYSLERSKIYENKNTEHIAFTNESQFIEFNLSEIQEFLNLGNIIPMGIHSSRIISDILYRSGMTRDVVSMVISNFKIIDINDIYFRFLQSQ